MSRHLKILVATVLVVSGCDGRAIVDETPGPRPLAVRAQRRAYAGAPPVIPHPPLTGACTTCHTQEGSRVVTGVGVAPANPHTETPGLSAHSRCKQCHVFQQTEELFVASGFEPFHRTVVSGERAHLLAPPTVPHPLFMREDCNACHAGPAARPEIRCEHAHRTRCQQCHVREDNSLVLR